LRADDLAIGSRGVAGFAVSRLTAAFSATFATL
jgi:hypothetical protein